jgi:hypothetical protein
LTRKLIEKEVLSELKREYGSIYELTVFEITHEQDQVATNHRVYALADHAQNNSSSPDPDASNR